MTQYSRINATIEEEFRRITLKPLQSTFFGKLDEYTPKLLRLYRRTGGAVGKKLDETLEIMNEASIQEAITSFVLDIFVVSKARDGGLEKQAGIAIEGAEVLAHACTYLMGLIYALELSYPKKLKYTFEREMGHKREYFVPLACVFHRRGPWLDKGFQDPSEGGTRVSSVFEGPKEGLHS
ncbi:unnamed protein product [Leuciscus chuanchicus]